MTLNQLYAFFSLPTLAFKALSGMVEERFRLQCLFL